MEKRMTGTLRPDQCGSLYTYFCQICSMGPRWMGTTGQQQVLKFLEEFLAGNADVVYVREPFRYLNFHQVTAELCLVGDVRETNVPCQALAYSGETPVGGIITRLNYVGQGTPEDFAVLKSGEVQGQVILTDALKSYEAAQGRKWLAPQE
ncbi:hypothetical protein SDD30_08895 [Moorella naiadis]|uniref:hypothetical protein n=1 Tax=Moorella naiadis (nom. illeg.) TaxID=3093670 RepID=UPI003D9CA4C3